jgi:hypothetical protein
MSSSLPVVRSGGVTKTKTKTKTKAKDSGLRSFVPDGYDAPKLSPKLSPPAPVLG